MNRKEIKVQDSPLNMKEGHVIEALDDCLLHCIDCCRVPCHMEMELRCPSVLFNEVEFAMVFGVKVAQMPMRLDQLLKLGLLRDEIRLQKKNAPATTVSMARW